MSKYKILDLSTGDYINSWRKSEKGYCSSFSGQVVYKVIKDSIFDTKEEAEDYLRAVVIYNTDIDMNDICFLFNRYDIVEVD